VSDNDCFKKTLLENNQNNFLIYIYIYRHLWNIDFTPMYDKKKYKLFHIMTGEKKSIVSSEISRQ